MEIQVGELIKKAKVSRCGDGDYPVLSMTMHDGLMFQNDRFKKQIASVDQSNYQVVKRHQLVESFPIDEGVLAVQELTEEGIVSPAYKIWDVNMDRAIPVYLELALRAPRSIEYYKSKLRGTTARRRSITDAEFCAMQINLPDLKEQERIIELISRARAISAKRQQELDTLDNLIKARFVELFGDIKDTCEVGYYIKTLTAGKSLAGEAECANKVLKTGAASFDFFDATQVKNLPLDYEPQEEHLVNPGDIIISRMNTAELTGAAAYVWDVQDKVYLPDRLWKANLTDGCNPIFVWQMLIQPSTKEQIRRECSGTSGSMKNISKPGMLAIRVKKVPLELQNRFAEFVKQIDKSKTAVQKSLDKTQMLLDSLMQEYFG